MSWSEIDADKSVWSLPGSRTKTIGRMKYRCLSRRWRSSTGLLFGRAANCCSAKQMVRSRAGPGPRRRLTVASWLPVPQTFQARDNAALAVARYPSQGRNPDGRYRHPAACHRGGAQSRLRRSGRRCRRLQSAPLRRREAGCSRPLGQSRRGDRIFSAGEGSADQAGVTRFRYCHCCRLAAAIRAPALQRSRAFAWHWQGVPRLQWNPPSTEHPSRLHRRRRLIQLAK